MTNAIRKYWLENTSVRFLGCPPLECADEFMMSVQAGGQAKSTPGLNLNSGDYDAWEVVDPTHSEPSLAPYADSERHPMFGAAAYVPTQIVNDIIAKHGGIVGPVGSRPELNRLAAAPEEAA